MSGGDEYGEGYTEGFEDGQQEMRLYKEAEISVCAFICTDTVVYDFAGELEDVKDLLEFLLARVEEQMEPDDDCEEEDEDDAT